MAAMVGYHGGASTVAS
ncbi:Conserved protein of unknown function, PPE family, PPE13 (part3) [Mycobacterium canettii CIPT 140070008]|nr:Conserved protein of unknown function, PPE family, PPE13 (part3) [Mycobacterium canettii CIPT 140070008]